jgi:hypothetical protein
LVAALDRPEVFANDPMGELMQIRQSMPPRRGSFWVAAGLRGTSFEIVNVTAVVYVALDRGVEVGVLGVARLAIPTDDFTIINVELAVKARFSSTEGVLSVQAQITDNSWFLFPNCQLTGGFALFVWFPKSTFLLTLGGYHPSFQKPPEYPVVPRLGYRYSLVVFTIKGESYFALTSSCVMFGARLEVVYGLDWVNVWFTAHADFIVSWDPFYYMGSVGVEIGATLRIHACLFGECVTVSLSFSLGAEVTLAGPPLHGKVTVDLDVTSITIPFGDEPKPDHNYLSWESFRLKYLYSGDSNGQSLRVSAVNGLLPPEPPGAQPAPGTADQPWRFSSEFAVQTSTTMPVQALIGIAESIEVDGVYDQLDLAPMGADHVLSGHGWRFFKKTMGNWGRVLPGNITMTPLVNQLAEAVWVFHPNDQVPAASNTVPFCTGVRLDAIAVAINVSGVIDIGKLVAAGHERPLPFAAQSGRTGLIAIGQAAESLAALGVILSDQGSTSVSHSILTGNGAFLQSRVAVGLSPDGLPPLAVRTLTRRRSSTPLLAPLSTGLTMKPVGVGSPPTVNKATAAEIIPLESPRLRTIVRLRPPVVVDRPATVRTTVGKNLAAAGVPRTSPPRSEFLLGARLHRIPDSKAARPTALTTFGRTLRNVEAGTSPTATSSSLFEAEAARFVGQGVTVASGSTYIWDVPRGPGRRLVLSGEAAARVAFLGRSGIPLQDIEVDLVLSQGGQSLSVPDSCNMIAVSCLGRTPGGGGILAPAPPPVLAFGAVSSVTAPPGAIPATGWQVGNISIQVGPAAYQVRGGILLTAAPNLAFHFGQPIGQAATTLSSAIAEQQGVETWLPPTTDVVLLLLDGVDLSAVDAGDVAVRVSGAQLAPPLRLTGGRRLGLLYDVTRQAASVDHLVVAAASQSGFRLAGVAGFRGRAREWAARMNGTVPEHFVPDAPLSPDGSIVARIEEMTLSGGTHG